MTVKAPLIEELLRDQTSGLHALFLDAHARPPFVRWQPVADELNHPALVRLLEGWHALRRGKPLPSYDLLRLNALGPLRDDAMIVEAIDGGADFEYSHYGKNIARHYGTNLRGRRVSQIPGHISTFFQSVYQAAMRRQEPVYTEHEPPKDVLVRSWSRLVLPFAGRDGSVEAFLVGNIAEDPMRGIIDAMMDAVILMDHRFNIALVNPAAEALFGYSEPELKGRHVGVILPGPLINTMDTNAGLSVVEDGQPKRRLNGRRADGRPLQLVAAMNTARLANSDYSVVCLRESDLVQDNSDEIRRLAYSDPLTGIANRFVFEDRLRHAIKQVKRHRRLMALHIIDLDGFKAVNDAYGHRVGDRVLNEFAERVKSVVRETDTFARWGGDEFAIVQTDLHSTDGAEQLAARILATLDPAPVIEGQIIPLRASVGIAIYPRCGRTVAGLLDAADRALYAAKRSGGHRWMVGAESTRLA